MSIFSHSFEFVQLGLIIANIIWLSRPAISELLVVDPTILEDQIREGDMTITMNIHKEICALSKAGGIPLEMEQVIRCSKIAIVKVTEITEQIQKALADDRQKRWVGRSAVAVCC